MTIFLLNMLACCVVAMAAIVLIILRERTDTQLLMAGLFIEALVALASLLWVSPDGVGSQLLAMWVFGRALEGAMMWYVVFAQVQGIYKQSIAPDPAAQLHKQIEELKKQIADITPQKEEDNATTH